MSGKTNQRNPAAWLTFISGSPTSKAAAFWEKSTLEYCYTITSHQSLAFSELQEFVCHVVLTFLLFTLDFPCVIAEQWCKTVHLERSSCYLILRFAVAKHTNDTAEKRLCY